MTIFLKASGYNNDLKYTEKTITKKRSRRRNVVWFNQQWNDEDRLFPKGSALGKQ